MRWRPLLCTSGLGQCHSRGAAAARYGVRVDDGLKRNMRLEENDENCNITWSWGLH
jgi:hypothetical protein